MFPFLLGGKRTATDIYEWAGVTDGALFRTGKNNGFSGSNDGQLGDGTNTDRSSPVQIGSLTTWAALVGVKWRTWIALKSDGTIWGSGDNNWGQLGKGNTTDYSSPVQIGSSTDWRVLAKGMHNYTNLIINSSGELWAVGKNGNGECGDGTTTDRHTLVQVGSDTDWQYLGNGQGRAWGVKTTGKLYGWGHNGYGQLGVSSDTTNRSSPSQVGALTNWGKITAGSRQFLNLKTDGTLWMVGRNHLGQLGQGNNTGDPGNVYGYTSSPVQVGSATNWTSIGSMDETAFMAINSSGQLWTWGDNSQGALGDGTTTNRSLMVQVGSLTNWAECATGTGSHAIKTDGTHWCWGKNDFGQLGLGNTTNISSPVQLGSSTSWKPFDTTQGHATFGIHL